MISNTLARSPSFGVNSTERYTLPIVLINTNLTLHGESILNDLRNFDHTDSLKYARKVINCLKQFIVLKLIAISNLNKSSSTVFVLSILVDITMSACLGEHRS